MRQRQRFGSIVLMIASGLTLLSACTEENSGGSGSAPAQDRASLPAPEPRDGLIPVGDLAPDFEGADHTGVTRRLSELLETKSVVLVFYPADFTPGCTKQLCNVRDDWSEFERRNALVLGVNPAGRERHADFAKEYGFPFPVISDPTARIAAAYGSRDAGRPENPTRTVYVIARDGRVTLSERGMVSHDHIFAALDRP